MTFNNLILTKSIFKMKTKILIFCFFISTFTYSQIQDLAKLAEGKIVYNTNLYDSNENLFGYFYLYERDADTQNKTMEYVFLDKNLNKISNKEFKIKLFKNVFSTYYECTLMGDYLILNKYYYYISGFISTSKPLLTTFQTISLKDNTVSGEYCYEDGQFKEFIADFDNMKKVYKGIETKSYVNGFNNGEFKGFFITEDNRKKSYLEKAVRFFDEKRELVWKYEYNPSGTENNYNSFHFLHVNKNTIYVAVPKMNNSNVINPLVIQYVIVALDMKTGQKKYEYILENLQSEFSHTLRVHEIDSKLYLTGNYSPYKTSDFSLDQNLGFYKIVLDDKGKEIEKKYTTWDNFKSQVEIDKRGRIDGNYRLKPVKTFFFKDGSISFLTEKYKIDNWNSGVPKTTDFVLFNMKPDFTIGGINTIKKELSYYSGNFLFSQYIKGQTGAVFFFYDVVKDPKSSIFNVNQNIFLGINTLINGKLTEEKIPLTSIKKYSIIPHPAKEGYIMLREYNEKDKYNQIRLEKLNY
jgi:hypothetical protein